MQIDVNVSHIDGIDQTQLPDCVVYECTKQECRAFVDDIKEDCENGQLSPDQDKSENQIEDPGT